MNRYYNIEIQNKSNELLKDLYTLDPGEYHLKNGILYTNNDYIISNKLYIFGDGNIIVDKYGNVKFLIDYNNKCISKTYLGNIEVENNICGKFEDINITMNKNNSKISFVSDTKHLEYKISSKDDFIGNWVKEDYKDNIVLKYFTEGYNYIWFKDSKGNLSDVVEFNVDCLHTSKAEYDSNVFYCSGSTVVLDDITWVVVKDENTRISLMKYLPLDEKLSHCTSEKSNYCYYTKDDKKTYDWENSYINYYLNFEFINELSDETKSKLLDQSICNDLESNCNGELCIGRSKEIIDAYKYSCGRYTGSRIKLISYDEFNYLVSKAEIKDVANGNYWSIDSTNLDNGTSVQYNQDFYILESLTNKLDIKPYITISK